jgi:hypothetical protein
MDEKETERTEAYMEKRIGFDKINRWRCVKIDAVVMAANDCCRGTDFQGCNKKHIYGCFNKALASRMKGTVPSYRADYERFVVLMDALARLEKRLFHERKAHIRTFLKDCGPGGVWEGQEEENHHGQEESQGEEEGGEGS